jgi:hypothetical protein
VMTGLTEKLNDVSTDKSGCTGDQHTHDRLLSQGQTAPTPIGYFCEY